MCVLSTIAASATANYLVIRHAGPQAAAIAATHGCTLAFTISASLLGLGAIIAILCGRHTAGSRNWSARPRSSSPRHRQR